MRRIACALSVSGMLLIAGVLSTGTANAASGTFFYRQLGDFLSLTNPPSNQCITLQVDAVQALNRTDSKALLYAGPSCAEAGLVTGIEPGGSWDGVLRTAKSVRFEFA